MLKTKTNKTSDGFSLIELVIITVLIGIISTVALTRTNTGIDYIKEQIAIDQITYDFDLARSMAFAQGRTITIKYNVDNESYSVHNELGIITDFPNSENGVVSLDNAYLKSLDIKAVDFGGDSEITFSPSGDLISGGSIQLNSKTISIESISGKWQVN